MPNLEVKRCNADGSVGISHVRVGHRQVLNERRTPLRELSGVFCCFLCLYFLVFWGLLDIAFYPLNRLMGFTSVDFEKVLVATNII